MKRILLVFAAVLFLGSMIALPVRADELQREEGFTELSQIMVANEAVEAKEIPDSKGNTVITYESGAYVFVIGETENGWYKVSYQDKEGYVKKSVLTVQEFDVEGMDKEFQEIEAEGKLVIEEVERYRVEAKRSRIWGIIIVLLVVGIFATGIISTTRMGEEKKKAAESTDLFNGESGEKKEKQKIGEEIIDLDQED